MYDKNGMMMVVMTVMVMVVVRRLVLERLDQENLDQERLVLERLDLERRWVFCRRSRSTRYTSVRPCYNRQRAVRRCLQITVTLETSYTTRHKSGRLSRPLTSWSKYAPNAGDFTAGWSTSKISRCRSTVTFRIGCSSRLQPRSSRWKGSGKRPSARNRH